MESSADQELFAAVRRFADAEQQLRKVMETAMSLQGNAALLAEAETRLAAATARLEEATSELREARRRFDDQQHPVSVSRIEPSAAPESTFAAPAAAPGGVSPVLLAVCALSVSVLALVVAVVS